MDSLLHTKIRLPPLQRQHIQRPQLLPTSLSTSVRLVLVAAPAGFGKSACLIQWAHHLRTEHTAVAWYALDQQDNDPVRFGAYLLESFRAIGIVPEATVPDYEPVDLHETINRIINAAGTITTPIVLIFDDYHVISDRQIHAAVSRLCEYAPTNLRLALGTRADPPLQLARLRVRGEIAEIRMRDLRFSPTELREWFTITLGWTPSPTSVDALMRVTEGWAAALALILMRNPPNDEAMQAQQLARYSRSQRHIFDYFAQEILDQQPDPVRRFLLDTGILNQLDPEVCTALADTPDAPILLHQIAEKSQFVIPLSDTAPIFRYHHLFGQFLRESLALEDRDRLLHNHRLAAQWYAANRDLVEAVNHALAAEDFDYAACLIENQAWAALTSRGEIMTLVHWLPQVPEHVLMKYLRLCLYFSRSLYLIGEIQRAEHYVHIAMSVLNNKENDSANQPTLRAIAYNYQATLEAYRGNVDTAQRWLEQSRDLQHHVDDLDRVRIANTAAYIRYLSGDVAEARRAYQDTLRLAEQINHEFLILDVHFYLAQIDLLAGQLQAVATRCEHQLATHRNRIGPLSAIMLPLAHVYYQRNQLTGAESLLREAIELAGQANLPDILLPGYLLLSDVLLARGLASESETCINHARDFASRYRSPMVDGLVGSVEARMQLRSGAIQPATEWASRFEQARKTGYQQDHEQITLAQIKLAQGAPRQALDILNDTADMAGRAGRMLYVLQAQTIQALVYQELTDSNAALAAIHQAITLAQPQGFVRLFLDIGPPIFHLLSLAAQKTGSGYASQLLAITAPPAPEQHPADILTDRELEVLGYIAAGASNQAIADALMLSIGTVKSHIHHIMGKLDARNRTEAVKKARHLQLLKD
jgi:LuxR family maltose regulon positive regulatory protein